VLGSGDVGHTLRVVVTATNAGGSVRATSDKTAVVIAATVTLVITQKVQGHRVNGRCRPKAKHGKRCTVTLTRSTRTLPGSSGANSIRLTFPRQAPGRDRATISARNVAGASQSVVLTFTIKPPSKPRRR
jgi:hypothetical protein